MKHGWFSLRQCPYKNSFLAVINTLITCHHSGQKREYSTADYELSNHINSFSNRQWAERRPSLNCLGDTKPISSVWSKKADAPYEHATCASLCGQLVAIGGNGGTSGSEIPTINAYDADKDSWYEIGKLATGRSHVLAAQLSEETVVVVGGKGRVGELLTEIVTGIL